MSLSFRYPLLGLLLLIIPLSLILWVWMRSGRSVVLPFDHGQQKSGVWFKGLINVAQSFPAVLLGVVVAILCGPQQLSEPRTKKRLTNIEFCVDISGSMTASFGDGTRYDASMEAINDFLDFRQGDAFALTFFGNSVMHWVPLTTDPSAIRYSPPYMRPENAPRGFGGTEIGKALLACRKRLMESEDGDRMILLVSDGFSSDLSGGNDMEIAKQLRDNNITVYAVHIAESAIPDQIVNITSVTGGEVFNPGDKEGLKAIFRRIDEMQQTELEKVAAETMDYYFPYCIAGLSLLGLSTFSLFGLRYTPW